VLTSIEGVKYWLASAFTSLGSNSFKIENRETNVRAFGGAFNATSGMTQFSDQDAQVSVRSLVQDGFSSGQFRDLSINDDGYITANYTNGTTRTLYQIPLASFQAPNALQRLDGGSYAATNDSGTPTLNAAGRGGTGNLTGSAASTQSGPVTLTANSTISGFSTTGTFNITVVASVDTDRDGLPDAVEAVLGIGGEYALER
jgi:flagellar hook protein FlgE